MNRKTIPLIASVTFAAAPLAKGQAYVGTVLYPLTPPAGISQDYSNIDCDNTGQAVATVDFGAAIFWPGTSSAVELNPGPSGATADAVQGNQEVGQYGLDAYLWTGSATSGVSLNPKGYAGSQALGTDGSQQVGYASTKPLYGNYAPSAFLWNGTAASAVDLNPSGISASEALGTDGAQQVGYAVPGEYLNACLWSGTAKSYLNLNPSGYLASIADGVNDGQQVGYASPPGTPPQLSLDFSDYHAILWTGTADSYVDLNPNGFLITAALGTNGSQQVGKGSYTATEPWQALLWNGTADSYVNLQGLLPQSDTWLASTADSIDAAGHVFGIAEDSNQNAFAVEWSPAPTLTWNNAGGAGDGCTWDIAGNQNWNNGACVTTYSAGAAVIFNDSNAGNYTVTLNTTVIASSVTVNNSSSNYIISGTGKIADAGAFVKTGSGTLTLGTSLSVGSMSISGGTLQLAANTTLGSGTATSNVILTSLSITGNGVLDVNNNHIIITYGSSDPITTIAGYIASGYNGGAWNGPGIISSAAQTSTNGLLYGLGYADGADGVVAGLSSGQIEVMYTLLGDANLDGLVNGSDFNILAANFNQSITGWDQGDFNYDGQINAADFNELAANFNQGVSGAASAGDVAALDAFAAANGLLVDVPEPKTGSLLLVAGAGLSVRRRRKQSV
jgi:hypothetical protein